MTSTDGQASPARVAREKDAQVSNSGVLGKTGDNADANLQRLSAKEREVLDQLVLHKPLKLIAHDLGVTLSAIDQRLKSARIKLGASDRNEAARIYATLLAASRDQAFSGSNDNAPQAFEAIVSAIGEEFGKAGSSDQDPSLEAGNEAVIIVTENDIYDPDSVAATLDRKFGKLWRVAAIPLMAVAIAVLALALISIAHTLGEVL